MSTRDGIEPAYHRLLQASRQAKIVLLHPESRLRSLLVARLLCDESAKVYYYALDLDDSNLFNLVICLTDALSKQHKTFGRHINLLPEATLRDPARHLQTIVSAFVKELSETALGEFFLVLDEFDRADQADDIHRFIERLSHHLPERCAIVLNGRSLPRLPWQAMMAKRQGLILRDDQLVMRQFYQRPNPADASIKILSLGPGFVFLNDQLVDEWEGHLPRLLLFFVLEHPEVTRNHVCRTFWPELDADQAVNVFHVTKRRLHKALGVDILAHDGAYYRVNPEVACYLDTQDFVERLLACRHGAAPASIDQWQRIARLYRGPFLHSHDDAWIVERREAYRLAYIEALMQSAEHWIGEGKHELALMTLGKAIEADYAQEILHRRALQLYHHLGRRAEAVAHYQALEAWAKANDKPLSAATQEMVQRIVS